MKKASADPGEVLQLKVVLRGIRPPVWRRVLVESGATFGHLHDVLQAAVVWTDCHLHLFTVAGVEVIDPEPGCPQEPGTRPSRTTRLCELVTPSVKRFVYTYDLGDEWNHDVTVEERLPHGVEESFFDPERFDLEPVNEALAALRASRRRRR